MGKLVWLVYLSKWLWWDRKRAATTKPPIRNSIKSSNFELLRKTQRKWEPRSRRQLIEGFDADGDAHATADAQPGTAALLAGSLQPVDEGHQDAAAWGRKKQHYFKAATRKALQPLRGNLSNKQPNHKIRIGYFCPTLAKKCPMSRQSKNLTKSQNLIGYNDDNLGTFRWHTTGLETGLSVQTLLIKTTTILRMVHLRI